MPTSIPANSERGFTLLEMLVALAIFSLAALALIRLQAVSVRTAADLDGRVLAEATARNIAFEQLTGPSPPAMGTSMGSIVNGGRTFQWRQTVGPGPDRRLVKISVSVSQGAGASPAVLSVLRAL